MHKEFRIKSLIILALTFFSFPLQSQAEPQITGLSGTTNSSHQIVLSGSNFGTRTLPQQKYFNNYSTSPVGQLPRGMSSSDTSFGGFVSSTNERVAGKPIIKFNYSCTAPSNGSNCEAWGRDTFDLGVGGAQEVFVTSWIYLDKTGTTNTQWQWKDTIWGSSVTHEGYPTTDSNQDSFYSAHVWDATTGWFGSAAFTYFGSWPTNTSAPGIASDAYLWNQWQRVEWYGKADPTNGIIYLNRIGRNVPLASLSNVQTLASGNDPWRIVGIGQALAAVNNTKGGSGSVANLNVYFDQLYIDTTRARVEVCDTSTWAARTHCEIQPTTAWNTGKINIKFNSGTFTLGQTAYLYVLDGNGVVNTQGYVVTVGSTYSAFSAPQNAIARITVSP